MKRFQNRFIPFFLSFSLFCSFADAESSLTLEDCIHLAWENNRSIGIAESKVQLATAYKNQMRSQLLPQISIEGVIDNSNRSLSGDLSQFQDFHSTRALGITSTLGLFDFGVSIKQFLASKLRIRASEDWKERTAFEVEERVKVLYFQILEREKSLEVLYASTGTLKEQLKKTRDLLQQGSNKNSDVLTVQVRLAEKEKVLLQAKNDLLKLRMELNQIIGLPLFETPTLKDVEEIRFTFAFEDALQYGLKHRTDLSALEKQLKALKYDHNAERWSVAPRFYAFGNGNYSSEHSHASFGVGMQMPIYQGGTREAKMDVLYSQITEVKLKIEDLKDHISLEIRDTYLQLEEINKSIEIDTKAKQLADENLKTMQELYEHGLVSIYDLLFADEQLTFAESQYYATVYRFHIFKAHLESITGGFVSGY